MRVSLLLLCSLLTAGCLAVGGDAAADEPRADAIESGLREVAERREAADGEVDAALATIRTADELIARSRRAVLVDESIERTPAVRDDLEALDPEAVREQWYELARVIDTTRVEVARAEEEGDGARALREAQDALLRAVREHAAAGDALLQLIDRHRTTYVSALDRIEAVGEERARYRDERELAAAVDLELGGVLDALDLARDELTEFRDRRRATGRAVNEASADLSTVLEQRAGG